MKIDEQSVANTRKISKRICTYYHLIIRDNFLHLIYYMNVCMSSSLINTY